MHFPLSFWDISLVLGVMALVLLITSALASYREKNLAIEKMVLKRIAWIFGFAFLLTVVFRVFQILSVV